MKDQLGLLLDKKMDRKDFLKYMAATGFMVFGGNMVLQAVLGANKFVPGHVSSKGAAASRSQSYGYGYGASAYGGNKVG